MKSVIFPTFVIATVYFLAATFLMNSRLAVDTLAGSYPILYKFNLLIALVLGMWSVMGAFGLTILLATAILTGANLTLLAQRLTTMSRLGNIHLVVGGSSLLGIATSGCAACGLPILSLLGVSGSLVFLPLRGLELTYLSLILLIISLVLLIKTKPVLKCKIKNE